MKIIKILAPTILLMFFFSCKDNKENKVDINTNHIIKDNMDINIDKIKKHIELQERIENEEEEFDNAYDLNLEDLDLVSSIVSEELKKNGYKNISDIDYNEKIKLIFKINLDKECEKYSVSNSFITLFGTRMDGNLKTLLDNQYGLYSSTENIFLNKNNHFLFNMFLLKDIIKINDNNSYELKVPKYIVARNKYIFNDSKSDFIWLRFNDSRFLESLVRKFGYMGDEELLKFVLDKSLKDSELFAQVVYTKDCSGKLVFHKEVIDLLNSTSHENQEKYLQAIYNYFEYLRDTPETDLDLTFSEKSEIQGKLAYYASKIAEKFTNGPYSYYSFFTFLSNEENAKEFQKRNFYNIKDFHEVYEETKTGGTSYPGMAE